MLMLEFKFDFQINNEVIFHIIQSYFLPILAAIFFFFFINTNHNLDKKIINKFKLVTFNILGLIIADIFEYWFGQLDHPTIWRMLAASSAYTLRITILFFFILLFSDGIKNKILFILVLIPALFNLVVSFGAFVNPDVFYYTSDNVLIRGPWISVPFSVSALYFFIFFIFSLKKFRKGYKGEFILTLFIFLISSFTTILEAVYSIRGVLSGACMLSCIFYYIYYLLTNYAHDTLTGAYIRYNLYTDCAKKKEYSLICFDVNGLKKINDEHGHKEGDKCLISICDSIRSTIPLSGTLYRMGGDEFVIILKTIEIDDLMDISRLIKNKVENEGYSIALGYSIKEKDDNTSLDNLLTSADKMMYQDKEFYKKSL